MAKYRDQSKLGSGGFGEVKRAIRITDEVVFAKKVLLDLSPDAVRRFQREVRLLSKLDHPRIVKVIEFYLTDTPPWYIMPLYPRSLRDELPSLVGNESRITKIVDAILEGMEYAHGQGIIHRDLKPENILLSDGDEVVISDFGLGRVIDSKSSRQTLPGQALGTLGYIAPEQLKDGKQADGRSDIFSIGRVIYELYSGDTPSAIQDLRLVPVGIGMVIDRCTAKDPQRRFQSVADLRAAFRSLVADRGTVSDEAKLRDLLAQAITAGTFYETTATEFGQLLAVSHANPDLMHEMCMGLPSGAIKVIWDINPTATKAMIKVFSEQVMGQSWGFSYTDKIADTLKRTHDAISDPEIRGIVISALVDIGVSHNRYHVMDLARELLQVRRPAEEGRAIAYALLEQRQNLAVLADSLNLAKVDPAIRDLFQADG